MKQTRISKLTRLSVFAAACAVVGLVASRGSANAPMGRFVVGTGTRAGTVADSVTGLTWTRAPADAASTWAAATTYCADLSFAGYSDWRLPTVKEFETIVDESRSSPAVDVDAFPAISSAIFWSSTSLPWDSTQALYVELSLGGISQMDKIYNGRVLCVR